MTKRTEINSLLDQLDADRLDAVLLFVRAHVERQEPHPHDSVMGIPRDAFGDLSSFRHTAHREEAAELHIPMRDDRRDEDSGHLLEGGFYRLADHCNEQTRGRIVCLHKLHDGYARCSYVDTGATCYPEFRSLILTAAPLPSSAADTAAPMRPAESPRVSAGPPTAPASAAMPAPQVTHVHRYTCSSLITKGKDWCDCRASEGHGAECARWEGFDLCDCSLSDDPYKERKASASAGDSNTLHRGDKPVREGEMREGSLAGCSVPQPAPLSPPIGARCAIRISAGNDAWGTVVEDKARPGRTLILIDGRGHIAVEKVQMVWWGVE